MAGDNGEPERAVELLKTAKNDWPELASHVESLLSRYLVVGTDASAITAPTWLNRKDTSPLTLTGKVTMVQFTAHWCGPCKYSYPAMRRLSQRFAKHGLQTVFFTRVYGYFGALRHLTPEEELAHDGKYYAGLGIVFPIAVGDASVEAAYKVDGLPQINLIDRQGRVRAVMTGWDAAHETRLAAQIQALLSEKQP